METSRPNNPYQPSTEQLLAPTPVQAPVQVEPLPSMVDDTSKTSMVMGIIAVSIASIPLVSLAAVLLGFGAISRAHQGRAIVEASEGRIRGKGCYVAGRILGIAGVLEGIVLTLVWLVGQCSGS
jgi:hypothetical protein